MGCLDEAERLADEDERRMASLVAPPDGIWACRVQLRRHSMPCRGQARPGTGDDDGGTMQTRSLSAGTTHAPKKV
jgi:hypothetical protein